MSLVDPDDKTKTATAVAADTTTGEAPTTTTFSCPLCCEEKIPIRERCVLSKCQHESCPACCIKWIEKVEAAGDPDRLPACPWCRVPMTLQEVEQFLGRPFQVATTRTDALQAGGGARAEEEMDDLTLQWLNEQTRPCPSCGARIFKIPGGCDMMECLCGFRFCYGCGSQGAQCNCTPAHHYFWDNVLDRAANRAAPPRATTNADTGEIDLRNHIQKRIKTEEAEKTKRLRAAKRQHYRQEIMTLDSLTSSAIWLYQPKNNQSSLRVLNQIVQQPKIAHNRRCWRHDRERRLQQQLQKPGGPGGIHSDGGLYGAKWLFECKGNGYKWLKYMTSQTNANLTKRVRHRRRLQNKRDLIHWDAMTRSATWLFRAPTNHQGIRILAEQTSTQASNTKISRRVRRNEATTFVGVSVAIANGSWLFSGRSKPDQTITRLYEHQTKQQSIRDGRRRKRMAFTRQPRSGLSGLFGPPDRDDLENGEHQNLKHLQWLFPTITVEEE